MSQMKPEIDGLSTAESAYQQALNASGTTMKQNAVYMQSIEARTTAFKTELEKLVLGKGGLETLGKIFISLGTGILSFINSLGGLTPLLTLIGGLVLSIKLESIKKSLTDLGNSIKKNILPNLRTFVSSFKEAKDAGMSFGESLEYAASEVNTLQLAISALTLVVSAGLMIWNKYRQAQEEAKQTAQNAIQSYDEYSGKLTDTYDKIINETTSKEELIKINKELSDSYDEEAAKLKDINDLRDEAIEKLYEEYILKNKETARETASEASKGREFFQETDEDTGLDKRQELEVYGQILDDINKKKEEELTLNEKLQRFWTQRAYDELKEEIEGYDKAIEANNEALENQNKTLVEFQNELKGFDLSAFPDIKKELENFSAGGHVNLTLRPIIDTEELNKQGYEAGKGIATVFSHTFSNEAGDVAMNFTPIMVDPETGEYLGVMESKEFTQYCKDVVNGVREDDLNLRIGAIWTGEDAAQKADQVGKRICKISNEVAASMTENNDIIEDSVDVLIAKYNLDEEEIQNLVDAQGLEYDEAVRLLAVQEKQSDSLDALAKEMGVSTDTLKQWSKELGISETEILKNAKAMNFSIDGYYKFATAVKHAKELHETSKNLISSISKLSSAFKEQAESGSLSVSTQLDLIESGYALALTYDEETGACKLNEKAVKSLVEAKLEMQIANLEAQRSEITSVLIAEANAAVVSANAFLELAKAKNVANKATLDYSGKTGGRNITDPSKSTSGYGGNFGYLAIDSSEAIKQVDALNAEINALQSTLGKVKSGGISAFDSISKGSGKAKDSAKEANKELQELIKKYEQVIKYINKRYDREIKKIKDAKSEAIKAEEKKIKAVEKEKDHALDAIEKEIKALKKEQDARKKYWSDRIDALKKQNDALKDSLELQEKLDALEKARNTKVKIYKEGQGFVYDVDQTEVAKAQKELDEYLSQKAYEDELERLEALRDAELDNYEKRLDALNEYKDSVQENYEKQIEQMNEYKDQLSEQYDAQIDEWENYKEQFGDLVDQYEEQQNKLLFEQLMGIKDENSNWLTRLDNLAEFVRKYNELQMKLNTGDTSVTNTATMKEGTGSGTGSPNRTSGTKPTTTATNIGGSSGGSKNTGQGGAGSYSGSTGLQLSALAANRKRVLGYASGTPSIKDNQLAIVGENPNQEIVIGSKLNNGQLMNLDKGTGVVNADSSKTLAGMLNQVGQFGASGFGSGNGTLNNNINNDSLTINGVTIQGANINDPETFVNGLLNMKAEALQRAYRHR